MAQIKKTDARLRQIKERQWEPRWGRHYLAATRADAREAPGISTGNILRPMKFDEREFHTLSEPEEFLALLALHNPDCWELHEQFVMFPKSREHPLQGHFAARGLQFKPFRGTLDVVERMGYSNHPRVRLRLGPDPTKWPMAPYPFTGDLRLFMKDELGVYCVNWPVKNKYADFRQKGPRSKPRPLDDLEDLAAIARQQVEAVYHSDAEIRTQPVSKDLLNLDLRLNLRNVFLDDSNPIPLDSDKRRDAVSRVSEFVGQDVPMFIVAKRISNEFSFDQQDAVSLIHQAIWRRELRVNLFRPVITTNPLHLEVTDVFLQYADWFRR